MKRSIEYDLQKNIKRIGHIDIPGGGQIVVDNGYAYVGHMKPPHGTTILDISNPATPKVVATIDLPDPYSHTHKVRVVGDLMYTNVEQNDRHFFRKSEELEATRKNLADTLMRAPTNRETADKLGVDEARIPELDEFLERGYTDGGFRIYDISDRSAPKLLSDTKTFGFGVHRFDVDENYAYISTEVEGYIGNILMIYDIKDPENPVVAGRWSMPGQNLAAGEMPTWKGYKNRLHHAMRVGDELWASVWHAGLRVLDASDITKPQTIGSFDYHPPFPEPTHTVLPFPDLIDGRRIAVAVDEEHAHTQGRLHGFLWVLDVSDLSDIKALSGFDVSELDSPWSRAPGRFGAHQFREKLEGTLVYVTWFSGGLRVVDVADPLHPVEVAHYIPEPIGGEPAPQSNDVDVDANGLIYLIDRNRGLDILEMSL